MAGFADLQFREAIKDRIVALDWDAWDRSADAPEHYPDGGEPEEYIWNEPHSPEAARRMPVAWELLPPVIRAEYEQIDGPRRGTVGPSRAVLPRRDYPDWFCTRDEFGEHVLTAAARASVERAAAEWVSFEPFRWRFDDPVLGGGGTAEPPRAPDAGRGER
jgi:hypothetical protein